MSVSPLAIPDAWDRVASGYESDIVPLFEDYARVAMRQAGVRHGNGMAVVDVATGPGTLAALASREGASVSAIDFSPEMIAKLEQRIASEGLRNITPIVGDGMALPFADATFDAGFSMFGLMFFPDQAKGFAELLRVLKPGAKAAISSWVPMTRVPLMFATFRILGELLPDLMPAKPLPPALGDTDSCCAEMTAAGFTDVEVIEHTATTIIPSMAEMVTSFKRSNAVVASLAHRAGDRWPEAEKQLQASLIEQFGSGPQTLAMTALITSGTRPC